MTHDKQFILSAANCPPEIAAAADVPWYFRGYAIENARGVTVTCECILQAMRVAKPDDPIPEGVEPYNVFLSPFEFVDLDRLVVVVFFGRCDRCGAASFCTSGPPYTKARPTIGETA